MFVCFSIFDFPGRFCICIDLGTPFYDSFTAGNFSDLLQLWIKSFTLLHFLIICGVYSNTKVCVVFTIPLTVVKVVFYSEWARTFSVCEAFRMFSQQLVFLLNLIWRISAYENDYNLLYFLIFIPFYSFKIMLPRTYQILWVLISNSIFLLACMWMRAFKNNFENYPKFWLRICISRALLVKQMCSECQIYTGNTKDSSRTDDITETSYMTINEW